MNAVVTRSLVIIAASLLTACASTPNTFINADPNVDFSQYKTFGYFPTLSTDKGQYESLVSNFLKVAVAQQFDRRGLTYDDDDPQLLVNFYINTKEKIRTRSVPSAGGYYGYRDPFYSPWGGYGMGMGYETRVDQYTEGTLNIDVVDAATKKLVWEGAIAGRLSDKDIRNMETTVDGAVASVMMGYPIQPGGAQ
ncbi:MAG: DUF4136 domain-containing protein [Gammaproteobacteria bacterium]|nr:DUF4136 domain-containing protein [Gammaproteobacteria bacterium]MDH4314117.1 DUF4136 domain-containing protein [Gammaproteobacteria bacterium]MDH5213159.1 DUF4136 domain-containing protein [Gammaproteobacteria bacterium]